MIKIVGIERHEYAPELNRVHLSNGKVIPTPGCVTIVQVWEAVRNHIEGLSDRPEENEQSSAAYLLAMLAAQRRSV